MSDGGKRMGVYGTSGSGKTTYVKKLVREMPRLVVFDPEEEYSDLPGMVTVDHPRRLGEILDDCKDGHFRVAFVPEEGREEFDLDQVCKLVSQVQRPFLTGEHTLKTTLVVDELNLSFPLNWQPKFNQFARACSRGRKRGINVIGVTQRPAEVGTRFRGNLNRVACFRLSVPNDWKVIRETMGPDAETAVRELGQFSHVFWENGDWKAVKPS
ncbi:MAG: helicase HerA domain-containing protein [Magnetospiraceae bacterium]